MSSLITEPNDAICLVICSAEGFQIFHGGIMSNFRISRVVAAAGTFVAAVGLSTAAAAPASATTYYRSDICSYSNVFSCFTVRYSSVSNNGGLSPCFIANLSVRSYAGFKDFEDNYYKNMFDFYSQKSGNRQICTWGSSSAGKGQTVYNNAASAADGDSAAYRVYYSSGYTGTYQTFSAHTSLKNLNSSLKNNNASSKRL